MTKHEADVIGGLNMTDQISNEAYKQIMIAAQDENDPCEDAISRQAVLDSIHANCVYENEYNLTAKHIEDAVKQLPPVTPQPKTGQWMFVDKAKEHARCSECGYGDVDLFNGKPHNYCEKCGVKMESEVQS